MLFRSYKRSRSSNLHREFHKTLLLEGKSRYERNLKRNTKLCKHCRSMGARKQNRGGPKNISWRYAHHVHVHVTVYRGFVLRLKANLAVSQEYVPRENVPHRKEDSRMRSSVSRRTCRFVDCVRLAWNIHRVQWAKI